MRPGLSREDMARAALGLTNTESFYTARQEVRTNVFEELETTVRYTNRSGVRIVIVPAAMCLVRQSCTQDAGVKYAGRNFSIIARARDPRVGG